MADKKNITKIEALPKLGAFTAEPARKKRGAAYARVSTDHEEQETSFEAQKDYYMRMILERPDWELVKVYADQGISAASVKRRKQFSQMIEDCEAGKIDIVLCKSISRFARNTLDSLTVIRRLKELGIGIWFEKEAIWTLDSKGELLITIMSSISQEESRSISENVKWGRRKMFQDGKGSLAYSRFLGYDRGKHKFEMVIMIHEMARSLIKERGILEDFMDTVRESQSEGKAADVEDYLGCFMERDGWEMYEDLDDLAYIIKRIVVEEDGRLTVELLDGTTTSCDIPEYSPIMKKSVDEEDTEDIKDIPDDGADRCKRCGAKLVQQPGKKRKVFCSDSCRIRWWRDHPEARGRKAVRTYTCIHCGKEFEAGRSAGRKFCSKERYTEHRFGKTEG